MEFKKTIATTLVGVVSLVGAGTTDIGQKTIKCTGKQVQIEYGENYFCGTGDEHTSNKSSLKQRLTENKTHNEEFAYIQLVARNDEVFASEATDILLAKYDTKTNQFVGTEFDSDIVNQLALFIDLADQKCAGSCQIDTTKTISEEAFKILSTK